MGDAYSGRLGVYNLIIARTFIESNIPTELLEAAQMDGCSDIRFFASIVLPLSKAVIAVLVLFYGVSHWNSYFNAMIYLNDKELYPLTIYLKEILMASRLILLPLPIRSCRIRLQEWRP